MDKAIKVVKRGSARLLGGDQGDLSVCISEQRGVRNAAKAFMNAQISATEYQMKWAANSENRALLDVTNQVWELNGVWTQVQTRFIDDLREYQDLYERLVEDERMVELARITVDGGEEKLKRAQKNLRRSIKKGGVEGTQEPRDRANEKEKESHKAHEVTTIQSENEAVKLIRFKQALTKLSESYMWLGENCSVIFEAQRELANLLPTITDQRLSELTYSGAIKAREIVKEVRDRLGLPLTGSPENTQARRGSHEPTKSTPPTSHGQSSGRQSFHGPYSEKRDSLGKSSRYREGHLQSVGGGESCSPTMSVSAHCLSTHRLAADATTSAKYHEAGWHQLTGMMEPPPPYTSSSRTSGVGASAEVLNSTLSPNITERRTPKRIHPSRPIDICPPPVYPNYSEKNPENIGEIYSRNGEEIIHISGEISPLAVRSVGLYPRLKDYFPDVTDSEKAKCCAMKQDPNEKEMTTPYRNSTIRKNSGSPFA